jgi:hypothetical protein
MSIMMPYRMKELVKVLSTAPDDANTDVVQASERLMHAGDAAIPPLIEALATAHTPVHLETLLGSLLRTATLPHFCAGLAHTDRHVVASVVKILSQGKTYDPHDLLGLFGDPHVAPADLARILACHEHRLRPNILLAMLDSVEHEALRQILRLLDHTATEAAMPGLLARAQDPRPLVRLHVARMLSRFNTATAQAALLGLLDDPEEPVREATLEALAHIGVEADNEPICQLLRESSVTLQSKVIETLVQLNDPQTIPILLTLLQDQAAHVRRGAVEVLQAIADHRAIEGLQSALNDRDWWVRTRAADALEKLGYSGGAEERAHRDSDAAVGTESPVAPTARSEPHAGTTSRRRRSAGSASRASTRRSGHLINTDELQPDTMLAGRYRIIRPVGKGAFGTTVLAQDTVMHEDIVLKFLNPDVCANDDLVRRFIRELRLARRVTHQNVVSIYNFVAIEGSYAISMEYFPGHNLADEQPDGGGLEFTRGLHIVQGVCDGMRAAHQADVVHRDLKPQNILVNDAGHAKIVDFGLAAAVNAAESRLTQSGVFLGTPTYIAPELIRGRQFDARVDVYSLGVIMYELFTGQPPYKGDNTWAVLYQHIEGNPTPPRQHNPAISPALEEVILKAMTPDLDARFESMEALQASLVALPEGQR